MATVKRYVIGPNEDKVGAVLFGDSTNVQEVPEIYWRATLWGTTEAPADNQIEGDRAADVTTREPLDSGMTFRALEIPPDLKDTKHHIEVLQQLNADVKQKYPPTDWDLARSPSMHRTDTLDCFVVVYGEITIVTDTDETLLKPGDTVVVRGVNHAWSNRSDKPCMIVGTMTHATPWTPEEYEAP
jgi:mannose-6-phosphate isomerase-like protein (cupin superfamily)